MSEEARAFMQDGEPPIVFTAGSANRTAPDFFRASIEACQRLGRRGLMLTPHPEQLPDPLPEGIACFGYIPLSEALPHAAALAHHGGIGMSSIALASGVPQLVTPRCFDQPDNAARLGRLGVARTLATKHYDAARAAETLRHLIEDPDVAAACRSQRERMAGRDGLAEAADAAEELGERLIAADR